MDFYYSSIKFVFSKYQTFVNTNAYTIYNDENDWIYNDECTGTKELELHY